MIDKKTKGSIINLLRRLSYRHGSNSQCRKRNKIDKALFECSICKKICYDGKSKKTFEMYRNKYPDRLVEMEKIQIDHISSVVPIQKNWNWDWNQYIDNLFCSIEGLQAICVTCHSSKSEEERKLRAELRKS